MDHPADEGIVKPDPKSRGGCNNRLVSVTKLSGDNYSLLFLTSRPRRVRRVLGNVCKLGYFLPGPAVDDDLVSGMVKDFLLWLICPNQVSSPLNERPRPGL